MHAPYGIIAIVTNAQKCVLLLGVLAVTFIFVFPSWHQICQGHEPAYEAELGRHLFWDTPRATGEQSWIENYAPWQCKASIEWGPLFRQCLMACLITAILFVGFKPLRFTTKKAALMSLLVSLCLPFPSPPDFSIPVVVMVVMSPKLLYDCGFGSCGLPLVTAMVLLLYFVVGFVLFKGINLVSMRSSNDM